MMREFFEKVDFEKNLQTTKKHAKLPSRLRVNAVNFAYWENFQIFLSSADFFQN